MQDRTLVRRNASMKTDSTYRLLVAIGVLLLSLIAVTCKTLEPPMPATTTGPAATLQGHTDAITCVAFSPDGNTLASSSGDTTARLWDVATGKELVTLYEHPSTVYAVAFSPDGTLLASGSGWYWVPSSPLRPGEREEPHTAIPEVGTPVPLTSNMVILWDVATGTEQRRWEFENPVYTVAFSPDGSMLATGGGDPSGGSFGEDAVWLWDVATGKLDKTLREREYATVWNIVFSPDGTTLASGNARGITLWDVATGEARASLSGDGRVAFSPNGTLLASGHPNGKIRLWDVATNREQATLDKHDGIVYALSFIRLWDVPTTDAVAVIRIPQTRIWSVAFSPDGTLLASGSSDGLVRLWDVAQVLRR
jgi:WD40 repeat protein